MKLAFLVLMPLPISNAFSKEASMFDLMRASTHSPGSNYPAAQALDRSVVVVRGYDDSVTEALSMTRQSLLMSIPTYTTLFKLEVTEVLKGDVPGEYVYFEFIRGGMPADFFDAVKYQEGVLLYLTEVDWIGDAIVENSTKGLMGEVDHLYMLLSEDTFYELNDDPNAVRNRSTNSSSGLGATRQ